MATIYDIAKSCGLSPATVSKALSGAPDVSEKTRNKVKETASRMDYVPDGRAKALSQNHSFTISVLCQDGSDLGLKHYLFASIIESFRNVVEKHGYDIVFISNQVGNLGLSYYGHCRYRKADGVFIIYTNYASKNAEELIKSDIPKIAFDFSNESISCVMTDCDKSMELLYGHLYDLGHRNIVYLFGDKIYITEKRIEGLKKAMEKRGERFGPDRLIQSKYYSLKGGYNAMKEALSRENRPTAVIASDDYSAFGAIKAVQDAGLSVPQDVSIVGFDGINIAQFSNPKLTTIRQNTDDIGRKAAEYLIDQITGKNRAARTENIILEPELLIGNSSQRI